VNYEECPKCGKHLSPEDQEAGAACVREDCPKWVGWSLDRSTSYVDPFDIKLDSVDEPPSNRQVNGDHYKSMAIQPSEFIYRNSLDWYEGNAVKYICRHRRKGGRVDLEKAIHYLELAIEAEYAKSAEQES
jgi:hypothetical protein